MSVGDTPPAADRLAAAKLWLIATSHERGADLPYLAAALYALTTVPTDRVPRLAADRRWRLYANPEWLGRTKVTEIAGRLAHLVWHLLLDHSGRARACQVGSGESGTWALAADACVRQVLDDAGVANTDLLSAADLALPPGGSTEAYFASLTRLPARAPTAGDISATPESECGSACDSAPRDYELPADADVGTIGDLAAEDIRRAVAIEFQGHVTGRGTLPGELLRWVSATLDPVVPWQQVLGVAVRQAAASINGVTDYTYGRPSRRQAAVPRVILPATRRPLPEVAVVVDTSGSVDDGLLAQALGEVDGALRALGVGGSAITVLACDAAVHAVTRVRSARDVRLIGAGGTDMRVGMATADALRPRPDVVIVLTDGYTPWPDRPPPGSAVIAAMLGRERASMPPSPQWARRVECVP
jgi:predicted metal-dependent peptidase